MKRTLWLWGVLFVFLSMGMFQIAWGQEDSAQSPTAPVQITEGSPAQTAESATTQKIGESVKRTGSQVVEQGSQFWKEVILPIVQRIVSGFPTLVKAFVILLIFWIIAMMLGALVTKLLGMTELDNRIVRELGLEKALRTADGKERSVEKIAGKATKWLILLFGFVAFLQVLNLQMVAGPLQNVLDKILGVIPHLLKGFFILIVYWAIATLVRLALVKGLGLVNFDDRAQKYFPKTKKADEKRSPSQMIGRLVFYVILLFGIPSFLNALGQESLVQPLQGMLTKAFSYLPNIIAAIVIFFVGFIIATIVREIVSNFLAALGADEGAERLGIGKVVGKKKISQIAGSVLYFFILIPVLVSSVDALAIKAISDPIKATLERILAAIPGILAATVIICVGFIVAKMIRSLVETFLSGVGFDALPEKLGLNFLKPKKEGASLSTVTGAIVMVIILLLTAQEALAALGFDQLSALLNQLILYLPILIVGLLILFASLSIGAYLGNLAGKATSGSGFSNVIANITKYAIIFFGASIALNHMGVGREIITVIVGAVLGSTALALGLAFGLGGKEKAKEIIEKNAQKRG